MPVLPDVLDYGLKVVFCGAAAGTKSARVGAYYAGPGNRFWETLYRIGLTPRRLDPAEYPSLLQYGVGLTDLIKTQYGRDSNLEFEGDAGESLRGRIAEYEPRVLAFNGKRPAQEFLLRPVKYGLQEETIGGTAIFVLPSTSGAAIGHWDETYWAALAVYLRELEDEAG
ncbi:MAG: mismatch-specific DNA-glycosylase [Chloroflexi bacterium]|nr:MAG: mismatch-specific DNA-glycosylase [Chloroflexota bacterium]